MSEETPLPKDHPMMVAWDTYRATEEYRNSFKWASDVQHRPGSMWAAFMTGYMAASERLQATIDQCDGQRRLMRDQFYEADARPTRDVRELTLNELTAWRSRLELLESGGGNTFGLLRQVEQEIRRRCGGDHSAKPKE